MTATYVPFVGNNAIVSIKNGAGTALAKTDTTGGNGRNSRTRLVLRLDDLDLTSTANDRVVTIVVQAPPAMQLSAFGTAGESTYTPWMGVTGADAASVAAMPTVKPFLAVTAVNTTTRQITIVMTAITGADNVSLLLNIDFCHSIV